MGQGVARRMYELIEPIGLIPYSAEEPNTAMFALGFTRYWDVYFAGRAAPLGSSVPAGVVHALFYNFAPGEVARHIPKVWSTTTPEAAVAAREEGCVLALRRLLGDLVDTADFRRAVELLTAAAISAPLDGRPMYAALHALPLPAEPVSRLFRVASMLREHRGDGHITALMAEGISGLEAHVLLAVDIGVPASKFGRIHHLPSPVLTDLIDTMRQRGLVVDETTFTPDRPRHQGSCRGPDRRARVRSLRGPGRCRARRADGAASPARAAALRGSRGMRDELSYRPAGQLSQAGTYSHRTGWL